MPSPFRALSLCLPLLLALAAPVRAQYGSGPAGPRPPFRNPVKEVHVQDIRLQGNRTVDPSLVLNTVQVQKGQDYLPPVLREKVQESIYALHQLGLFADVQVEVATPDSVEGAILTFRVKELPTLAKAELKGNKKLKDEDVREAMDLLDGQVYSRSAIEKNRQKILNLYKEKGYLLAKVDVDERDDAETGRKIVRFGIDEGRKVEVRGIYFHCNRAVEGSKLRDLMKVKEDRAWRSGEFKEDDFRTSLDSVLDYYREQGFLDAAVADQRFSYSPDRRSMFIDVTVSEGKRYYFGKAGFVHNGILDDKALKAQVILDSGEVFNQKKYEAMKYGIQSLYREEGYLFVDLQDQRTYRDSVVDVAFNIKENNLAHIHKVHVRGNTKTKDKVIRREIRLFPGDIYRQSLVLRSQRDIMQLNYFDNVAPNIEFDKEEDASDVDLVFDVTEKAAGTGTFSAGAAYDQHSGFVGTLGLQIPNVLGNGQRLDANLEYGINKKLVSLGFTEPWFMDTPTLLGGSVFYDWEKALRAGDPDFSRYGFKANLGRRLTWPDDYFSVSGSYNLTENNNGYFRDKSYLLVPSGLESSVSLTLTRDDKDLPVFPTEGSRYRLTVAQVGGPLGGDFDYRQYDGQVNWWFPAFRKLVLGLETELGALDGPNLQTYSLYQMGGTLGYQGKMRGYSPGEIGASRIGRSFFSFVSELTYPVVENTFYVLGFFDAGNVFGATPRFFDYTNVVGTLNPIRAGKLHGPLEDVDLTDLKRDLGLGFRLVVPLVGIMGFDFGWPLDPGESYRDASPYSEDWHFNFVVEQGF